MKKKLIILNAIGLVVLSGITAFYLLITVPSMAQKQLDFDKQKQQTADDLKKTSLRNECLALKYGNTPSKTSSNGVSSPNYQAYEQANMKCD